MEHHATEKGTVADKGDAIRDWGGDEAAAAAEGAVADGGDAGGEGDVGKGGAAVEGPSADGGDVGGDGDGGEVGAAIEGPAFDGCDAGGDDEAAGEGGRVFDQSGEDFVEEDAVDTGVVRVVRVGCYGGEGSAVFEGVASDPDNAAGKGDGGEG